MLFCVKALLHSFSESTRLKVNYHKSLMIPINVPEDKIQRLALTFGCIVGSLPFTYLGLPMGTTKPRMQGLTRIMATVEKEINSDNNSSLVF